MEITLATLAVLGLFACVGYLIRHAEMAPLLELRPSPPVYLYERPEFHVRAMKILRDQNAADLESLNRNR